MPQLIRQAQLVRQIIAADPEAIGELYDLYGAKVYLVAHRVMASPDDAEDIVQDVFLGLILDLITLCPL